MYLYWFEVPNLKGHTKCPLRDKVCETTKNTMLSDVME